MDGQNQEHHDSQRKVKNVPISEQPAERLEKGDLRAETGLFQGQSHRSLFESLRPTPPPDKITDMRLPSPPGKKTMVTPKESVRETSGLFRTDLAGEFCKN